jgi:hypothetical protein
MQDAQRVLEEVLQDGGRAPDGPDTFRQEVQTLRTEVRRSDAPPGRLTVRRGGMTSRFVLKILLHKGLDEWTEPTP